VQHVPLRIAACLALAAAACRPGDQPGPTPADPDAGAPLPGEPDARAPGPGEPDAAPVDPVDPVDTTAPVTVAAPPADRVYQNGVTVALTTDEPAATYYTLDGSEPTAGSARYAAPIRLEVTSTLRFFSVDPAGNAEIRQSHRYRIDVVRRLLLDVAAF
jgi:hypothetical protein